MSVWRRLLTDAQTGVDAIALFLPSSAARSVRSSLAPSLHESVVLAEDPYGKWRSLIGPDRPERAFALVAAEAPLLMGGAPTEEAGDAFREAAAKASRERSARPAAP